jgi:hypothetical protein
VLDRQGMARYIGALDDATHENRDGKNFYLDRAVTALLNNRQPQPAWTPPYGCELVRDNARAKG